MQRNDESMANTEAQPSLLSRYAEWIPDAARVLVLGAVSGHDEKFLVDHDCQVAALAGNPADFMSFAPDEAFDVILCLDVMPILRYQDCASLVTRLHQWLRSGGTLFLTARHLGDPAFAAYEEQWRRLGIRSFCAPDGTRHRLFLEQGEIPRLFFRWQPVLIQEKGLGSDDPGAVTAVLTRP